MSNLFVRKLEAYASLTPERRREIEVMTSRAQLLGPHVNILYDGEEAHAVNVVQSGWVCRYKVLRDGHRQITALYLPGDLCGSYVFLPDAMRQTLSTLTPVVLARASATLTRFAGRPLPPQIAARGSILDADRGSTFDAD